MGRDETSLKVQFDEPVDRPFLRKTLRQQTSPNQAPPNSSGELVCADADKRRGQRQSGD